jgi:hypothetical protein
LCATLTDRQCDRPTNRQKLFSQKIWQLKFYIYLCD